MAILGGVGKDTVKEAGAVVDDIQADLDKRWAALLALLQGKRVRVTSTTTFELEDKPNA